MIYYSFMFMTEASYSRFSNWLALEFKIPCVVENDVLSGMDEEPIEGHFFIAVEQHEAFLKRWGEVEEDFHMQLRKA